MLEMWVSYLWECSLGENTINTSAGVLAVEKGCLHQKTGFTAAKIERSVLILTRGAVDTHAPSPTITSFLRISAMMRCRFDVVVEVEEGVCVGDGLLGFFEGRSCKTRQEATTVLSAKSGCLRRKVDWGPREDKGARSLDYGSSTGKRG